MHKILTYKRNYSNPRAKPLFDVHLLMRGKKRSRALDILCRLVCSNPFLRVMFTYNETFSFRFISLRKIIKSLALLHTCYIHYFVKLSQQNQIKLNPYLTMMLLYIFTYFLQRIDFKSSLKSFHTF